MKKLTQTILAVVLLSACETQDSQTDVNSKLGSKNLTFINELDTNLTTLQEVSFENMKQDSLIEQGFETSFGEKVSLYKELVDLFDPSKFDCGCDDKMKKALRKTKPKNQKVEGFVPDVVSNNAFIADTVLLLSMQGSNILAHLFQYSDSAGVLSKPLFTKNAATVSNFNESRYIEQNPKTYDHFLYTLDCNGFITAAVKATGGLSAASIKTSASVGVSAKKSLFILGGVMYSPLYQAYKGDGLFTRNDTLRINVLESILKEIPTQEQIDNTQILLNANYKVILASNSGNSSFNGEGSLGASGNAAFGFGSVQGEVNASGSIGRTSNYTKYKTYVIEKNVNTEPLIITFKNLKDLIAELKNRSN